jgi:hypothetical protein
MRSIAPLLTLLLAWACSSSQPAAPEPTERPAQSEHGTTPGEHEPAALDRGARSAAAGCERLSRTFCLDSPDCTLVWVATRPRGQHEYACRAAEGPCEEGLVQARLYDAPGRCTSRPGCAYQEQQCYCDCRGYGQTAVPDGVEAEECDCECAGGRPPGCVAQ